MKMQIVHLLLAWSIFAFTSAAADLKPPCKTPGELLKCAKHALQTQNTNLFWELHCWTNVSPRLERFHKWALASYFKKYPEDQITFSSFRILPARPEHNRTRVRKDGGLAKENLTVEGWITFKQETSSRLEGLNKPYKSAGDGELLFGRGPDSNYWFTVGVIIPAAVTNSVIKP